MPPAGRIRKRRRVRVPQGPSPYGRPGPDGGERPLRRARILSRRRAGGFGARDRRRHHRRHLVRGTPGLHRRDPRAAWHQDVRGAAGQPIALARRGTRAVQDAGLGAAAVSRRRGAAASQSGGRAALARRARRPDARARRAGPRHSHAHRRRPGEGGQGDRRHGPEGPARGRARARRIFTAQPARFLHAGARGAPRLPEAVRIPRRR